MPVKLKYPWMGIAIPCFLISFIAYTAHYFILLNFLSIGKQIWFEISVTMIWISYYLAIYTNPGKPGSNYIPPSNQWKNYCKKCNAYKPERTHHCKTCQQCVLMMDHHCPWTMNCVGYKNFPHFLRFLFWVIVTTTYLLYFLISRIVFLWKSRNLPSYLFNKSEIIFLTITTPMDGFVLLTISLLFIRCTVNQLLSGRTQIETWENERLESLFYLRRLKPQLISNLWEFHPELKTPDNEAKAEKIVSKRIRFDLLVSFPYDLGLINNITTVLGSPVTWLWFYGEPSGDGMLFKKNEYSLFEEDSILEDQILSLPWPPDGGKHGFNIENSSTNSIETSTKDGEHVIRKRSPVSKLLESRTQWYNDWGENLEDFGVDIDVE
ncbi:hypothetical protein Kpol_1037p23 [Vanderwaltozyma polyspora DSM 70294]|uniref:Palmitoyltransferase PFA4 n=1 Tax=Vanderwaltozyma polyspora (strain ATCC 22028 / DSM 70294 / BCRC 21397 / CBS 2163 / NBRC 10782 / NRRL Y-8283 / UCD 57-17) TaxID=436907 RepID=A7TJW5_VANPO|nr:uncharacterized protein Kpol_1037p23 [Vanderwaltozyma polyspora DSM 70294]EDO17427.1 hypothetical protein Kpol_1037p23 [Vanderwaltozyma polyspora DSM 70294]